MKSSTEVSQTHATKELLKGSGFGIGDTSSSGSTKCQMGKSDALVVRVFDLDCKLKHFILRVRLTFVLRWKYFPNQFRLLCSFFNCSKNRAVHREMKGPPLQADSWYYRRTKIILSYRNQRLVKN